MTASDESEPLAQLLLAVKAFLSSEYVPEECRDAFVDRLVELGYKEEELL